MSDDCNTCADRARSAQIKLEIIVRNGIADFEAMEMISVLVDEAGVEGAERSVMDQMPF
jgi:hypothetical protein